MGTPTDFGESRPKATRRTPLVILAGLLQKLLEGQFTLARVAAVKIMRAPARDARDNETVPAVFE